MAVLKLGTPARTPHPGAPGRYGSMVAGAVAPNFANRTMWTQDNLDVLRGLNSESIDLVYADPPSNSNRRTPQTRPRRDPRVRAIAQAADTQKSHSSPRNHRTAFAAV